MKKPTASHPLKGTNSLIYGAQDKAEFFADTYEKQFTLNSDPDSPEVSNFVNNFLTTSSPNHFTTPGTVLKIIKNIPKRKAPGFGSITNTALKFLPRSEVLLLTCIFNGFLRTGYFPKSWKRATIITILNPGKDHQYSANYRPISLFSSLFKVFEKVILTELAAVIFPKIRPKQFVFRSHHSTTHQLLGLVDRLTINAENRLRTAAIFLNIEKPFDRVWNSGLLYKLHQLETPIHLISILHSFLTNRSFVVRVEDATSTPRSIQAGVPQGSCLSPILYSIYTNDIPLNQNAILSLFTDDTLLTTTNKNPTRAAIQLQNQIDKAMDWFLKWKLRINTNKCISVVFNRPRLNTAPITISGLTIPWSPHAKYLSVTLNQYLNLNKHIQAQTKRATAMRSMLYPILNRRSPMPLTSKITCHHIYVNSIIKYAGLA